MGVSWSLILPRPSCRLRYTPGSHFCCKTPLGCLHHRPMCTAIQLSAAGHLQPHGLRCMVCGLGVLAAVMLVRPCPVAGTAYCAKGADHSSVCSMQGMLMDQCHAREEQCCDQKRQDRRCPGTILAKHDTLTWQKTTRGLLTILACRRPGCWEASFHFWCCRGEDFPAPRMNRVTCVCTQ